MPWWVEYWWAVGAPVVLVAVGWALMFIPNKALLHVACVNVYVSVWFLAVAVLWVGIVLAFAGWVWPMLFEQERMAHASEKIISAAIAWLLLFVGKQILELRHLHVAAKVLKRLIKCSLKHKVPRTRPVGVNVNPKDELAYRAFYDEQFSRDDFPAVIGWGMKASYRRLLAIHRIQTSLPASLG